MALSPDIRIEYPAVTTADTIDNIGQVNGAFGWNLVTLYDYNQTGVKMVLQVFSGVPPNIYNNKIAELRQYPNLQGYCHFDIRHILQNDLNFTNYENSPGLNGWIAHFGDEVNFYLLKWGYENVLGQSIIVQGTSFSGNTLMYIPARKPFNQLELDLDDYIIQQSAPFSGTYTAETGNMNPLTDRTHTHIIKNKEDFTISFPNFAYVNSISGSNIDLTCYNRAYVSWNLSDGTYGQSSTVTLGRGVDTFQLGYSNTDLKPHFDSGLLRQVAVNFTQNPAEGLPFKGFIFDVDLEDECRDYDPVQVSWINSFGFRDYFTFQKRWERRTTVTKNTYQKMLGNWGGGLMTIPSYSRGETVFSQRGVDGITLTTKFLEDNEAEFLRNLYLSPDVKIKFRDETEWIPVTLQDQEWTQRTFRKDKFFQYTINLNYSNDLNTQK